MGGMPNGRGDGEWACSLSRGFRERVNMCNLRTKGLE